VEGSTKARARQPRSLAFDKCAAEKFAKEI
jgi:hypothetical protein